MGEIELTDAGQKLAAARVELQRAIAQAKREAQALAEHGESEYTIAEMLGVARMTVRSWLGK